MKKSVKHKKKETKMSKHNQEQTAKEAQAYTTEAEKQKAKKVREPRISMISVWGETFARAAKEGLSQAEVEQLMIERFPQKEATVRKWTGWYKNFYNTGRIKGHENPVQVKWQTPAQQERIEKQEAKATARAEKLAAREQARAEKAATKAARKQKHEVAAQ